MRSTPADERDYERYANLSGPSPEDVHREDERIESAIQREVDAWRLARHNARSQHENRRD